MLHRAVFPIIFVPEYPSENSVSELLGFALARCKAVGLASLLPEELPDVILRGYKAFVRSAPWDRHSTTVILKQICSTLRVRIFRGPALPPTELIFIQESGLSGFSGSDIDTKLQLFWATFSWYILNDHISSQRLKIVYVKVILPLCISLIHPVGCMVDPACS